MPRLVLRGYGGDPARLVVRGYGVRPILVVPDISGSTFFDGLRAYLKSYPTLGEITEVYYRRTKPGAYFPYIIISPIFDNPELNNSHDYWEYSDVQISVLASGLESDEDAERLGQAAYRALAPKQINDAGSVVNREKIRSKFAIEMTALPGRKFRAEQPGRGAKNETVFAFYFNYRFLVSRSMVENDD